MIKIRLSRKGHKNKPFYRIVATDSKRKNKGAPLEVLGYWSPKEDKVKIKKDRVKYWVEKGAKTTPAVDKLL
jgi:small subunit ribosomal protein S16